VDLELVALLQPEQQVAVTRDHGTLVMIRTTAFTAREPLQPRASAEIVARRLIRIGCGAITMHSPAGTCFRSASTRDDLLLYKDPLFECFQPCAAAVIGRIQRR